MSQTIPFEIEAKLLKDQINAEWNAHRRYYDQRLDRLEQRFDRLDALVRNGTATSRWSQIQPVPCEDRTERGIVYYVPLGFPDRMIKFWHLKSASKHRDLVRLVEAYRAFDDEILEKPLKDYVKENIDEAHERLALVLNLPYSQIKLEMAIAEQQGLMSRAKRAHQLSSSGGDTQHKHFKAVDEDNEVVDDQAYTTPAAERWTPSTSSSIGVNKPWDSRKPSHPDSSIETSTTPKIGTEGGIFNVATTPANKPKSASPASSRSMTVRSKQASQTSDLSPRSDLLLSPTQRLSSERDSSSQ